MTLRISKTEANSLGFDLKAAITAHKIALLAHLKTINKPAPTAHPLVEEILRHHEGRFEIFDDRTPADLRNDLRIAIALGAQDRSAAILSPARQQLAAIDRTMLQGKAERTPEEDARLAEISEQNASLYEIQRHAALLSVELDELPDQDLPTWQPYGWPAL